jgi:hypothetical protein
MAAETVNEISTRRLTIVDDRGQVRATLGPAPDGSVELRLYDGEDRTRAELAVAANGVASLTLRDPAGEVRSCLAVSTEGDTRLHLHGTAAVSLHDASGQPRALLGLDEHSGKASLSYADVDGGCCVLLTEDASGGRLHLFQCDGTGRRIPAGDPADPENGAAVSRPKPPVPPPSVPARRSRSRWLRAALLVVLSAAIGTLVGGPGTPRSVARTAEHVPAPRKLVLSDAGTPRARPSALRDGTPLPWTTARPIPAPAGSRDDERRRVVEPRRHDAVPDVFRELLLGSRRAHRGGPEPP